MTIENFNKLPLKQLRHELSKCCGSSSWINHMIRMLPLTNLDQIKEKSIEAWLACTKEDWLEAFSYHPRIGEKEIRQKFNLTYDLAGSEQSGMQQASEVQAKEMAELNDAYFKKFGYIFIVFASGKTAAEMLDNLKERIRNTPEVEIKISAGEQLRITQLRLENLLS